MTLQSGFPGQKRQSGWNVTVSCPTGNSERSPSRLDESRVPRASEQSFGAAAKPDIMRTQVRKRAALPAAFLPSPAAGPPASKVVIEVPGPVPLRISQNRNRGGITLPVRPAEEEDRQRLSFDVLPLDAVNMAADELGVVLPLGLCRGAHAAILRTFRSDGCVVAARALPFAHCRSPVICSAISLESGTKSTSTSPMVKSEGASSSANARYMASTKSCSISAPVSPSVELLNCARSNCRVSLPCLVTWISQIVSRSSRFGRSTKK